MNTTTETRVPGPETMTETDMRIAGLEQAIARLNIPEPARDSQGNAIQIHGHTATKDFGEVVGAIAAVMAEIQPVEKGGKNTFHDYKYARMQDILQALTPLMGKHGIVVFQYEARRDMFDDGKVMAIGYNFIVAHKSGQTWITPVPQTGMSPCRTSKGTFDDKSFAKCHTSARKYFLLSLFQIPTEDEADPDNEQAARTNAPVPSPDGHLQPHKIAPQKRDTFDAWAGRYVAAIRTAKTDAELVAWDKLNDESLAMMSNAENGAPIYADIMKEFETLRARFRREPEAKTDPISTGISDEERAASAANLAQLRNQGIVPPAATDQPAPVVRPEGCPNPERDPDAFVIWGQRYMERMDNLAELDLAWENVIAPAANGLFKPDWDSLQAFYDTQQKRVG